MIYNPITKCNCQYGAPMGRPENGGTPGESVRLYLQRVRLDSGGYDSGGAYWGLGQPLYTCFDEAADYLRFFRASSRDRAKETIRGESPEAKFYR